MTVEKLRELIRGEVTLLPAGYRYRRPVPRIKCVDGFSLSVQVGEGIYSTPRDYDGPWTEVVVGYPSEREEALMPYVESPDRPTDTVYGYVPIEIVVDVINRHGGAL